MAAGRGGSGGRGTALQETPEMKPGATLLPESEVLHQQPAERVCGRNSKSSLCVRRGVWAHEWCTSGASGAGVRASPPSNGRKVKNLTPSPPQISAQAVAETMSLY